MSVPGRFDKKAEWKVMIVSPSAEVREKIFEQPRGRSLGL